MHSTGQTAQHGHDGGQTESLWDYTMELCGRQGWQLSAEATIIVLVSWFAMPMQLCVVIPLHTDISQ